MDFHYIFYIANSFLRSGSTNNSNSDDNKLSMETNSVSSDISMNPKISVISDFFDMLFPAAIADVEADLSSKYLARQPPMVLFNNHSLEASLGKRNYFE